ncbi:hypothetical protein FPV67DRAFT_1455907 [Lyophyllum atratum]|nr:hypothetical protein FPV67DRAFT_1455907 [Lyophyllum atratum]
MDPWNEPASQRSFLEGLPQEAAQMFEALFNRNQELEPANEQLQLYEQQQETRRQQEWAAQQSMPPFLPSTPPTSFPLPPRAHVSPIPFLIQRQSPPRCSPPRPLPTPPIGPTHTSTKGPKFASPPFFSGKMEDAKAFENSCKLYLIEEMNEAHANNEPLPCSDMDEFWVLFQEDFGDPNVQSTKIMQLRTIEQGSDTMEQHVQKFKQAARNLGFHGIPLVEEFKRSINDGLRDKLSNAEAPPVTIKKWYTRAMTADRTWRRTKAEKQLYQGLKAHAAKKPNTAGTGTVATAPQTQGNRNWNWRNQAQQSHTHNHVAPANPRPGRDPNAMDIDAGRKKEFLCYKCKKPGHMACDCRSRLDVRSVSRSSWTTGKQPQINWTTTGSNWTSGCSWGPCLIFAVAVARNGMLTTTGHNPSQPVATGLAVVLEADSKADTDT